MLTDESTKKETRDGNWKLGVAILIIGICIGAVADPYSWARAWLTSTARSVLKLDASAELPLPIRQAASTPAVIENGLETLSITVAAQHAAILKRVRDQGLETGIIRRAEAPNDGLVPATLTFDGQQYAAQIRIKGDWTDHINTDKWSFRIKLNDGVMLGTSEFSIQHPKTRDYLKGWLLQTALRREGILAPRSRFVNVVINNNWMGVYSLEEHLSKQMLESQDRREGPIVKFEEDDIWLTRIDFAMSHRGGLPPSMDPWDAVDKAKVSAFGMRRLTRVDALARQLDHALNQLEDFQRMLVAASNEQDQAAVLLARAELQETTIETIFDVDQNAAAHALCSVLADAHPLTWVNLRFYHNPITGKLEPVIFDVRTHSNDPERDPVIWDEPFICQLMVKNALYNEAFFRYLARYCNTDYLDGLLADLGPDLRRYEQALQMEGLLTGRHSVPQLLDDFRQRQQYLRKLLSPRAAVSFAAVLNDAPHGNSHEESNKKMIEVEAWTHSRTPVVLEGFRFDNGYRLQASSHMVDEGRHLRVVNGNGVILPLDGSRVSFRFPADRRLLGLNQVRQVKQFVRSKVDAAPDGVQPVWALWRSAAETQTRERMLLPRRIDNAWRAGGRPEAPTLREALEQHPMLIFEGDHDRLSMRRGTWTFDRDLHLPAGYALHVGPGITMHFAKGAALIAEGPLIFEGTEEEPIVLDAGRLPCLGLCPQKPTANGRRRSCQRAQNARILAGLCEACRGFDQRLGGGPGADPSP